MGAGMGMQEAAEVLAYCFSDAVEVAEPTADTAADVAAAEPAAAGPAENGSEAGQDGWSPIQLAGVAPVDVSMSVLSI